MTYIDYGDLLARFCLSFVFLWSGVSKALHPAAGRLCFTVIATLMAHGSWGLTGEKRQQQETTTFEHLAIVGGFLFVIIHGAGGLSVDNLLR
jgi:uncharacterized membrane protein YphA (DoxX/SURF4 family)